MTRFWLYSYLVAAGYVGGFAVGTLSGRSATVIVVGVLVPLVFFLAKWVEDEVRRLSVVPSWVDSEREEW